MKLSRYAQGYLVFIGLISVFQLLMGANLLVLLAIIFVSIFGIIPLSRKTFGPNDLLLLSFVFYYGTFSLVIKSLVLQTVDTNLKEPLLTSAFLASGFFLIYLAYAATERAMTKFYPGTNLRTWTIFEQTFSDFTFLSRFTLPFSIATLSLILLVSAFSNNAGDIVLHNESASSFNALAAYIPLAQLALSMQLTLVTQYKSTTMRTLTIVTLTASVLASIITNHKTVMFMLVITYVIHILAYRIRLKPAVIIMITAAAAVTILYVTPLIQIARGTQVQKSEIIGETFRILSENEYNPIELAETQQKLAVAGPLNRATELDYLYPLNLSTDRFTMLMPIDQVDRNENTAPLGFTNYIQSAIKETLPKAIVGDHDLQNTSDEIAWRFAIRNTGEISRPALGLLGTGLGIAGPVGLLVYAPLVALVLFAANKIVCNGSIWQNPFAVFIAANTFFAGESDFSSMTGLIRGFLPMIIVIYAMIYTNRYLSKI